MFGFGKKTGEVPQDEPLRAGGAGQYGSIVQMANESEVAKNTKAVENVEGRKLEWGQELGEMTWNQVQDKIVELNTGLAEGEKEWRLPTPDEILEALNDNIEFKVFEEGFNYYWTNKEGDDRAFAVVVETGTKKASVYGKANPNNIARLVRDLA